MAQSMRSPPVLITRFGSARNGTIRAISSLPVPVSPSINRVASVGYHLRHRLVDLHHAARAPDHLGFGHIVRRGFVLQIATDASARLPSFPPSGRSTVGDVVERSGALWPSRLPWCAARWPEDHRAGRIPGVALLRAHRVPAVVDVNVGNHDRIRTGGQICTIASLVDEAASTVYPSSPGKSRSWCGTPGSSAIRNRNRRAEAATYCRRPRASAPRSHLPGTGRDTALWTRLPSTAGGDRPSDRQFASGS